MANEEHLAILKQGVDTWNKWRKEQLWITPDLSGANLSGAHLSGAHLSEAYLSEATLSGADLRGVHLIEAHLYLADLREADLRKANLIMADLRKADLRGANLSGAHLSAANLSEANLIMANLYKADLHRAHLSAANLRQADLSEANLSEADLIMANLNGANLRGAYLNWANLRQAYLRQADLTNAWIGYTLFVNSDLSLIIGLETVSHEGPSTISIDSLYKSKGNIPYKFLLDAGLPKEALDYLLPLAGKAIYYHSCFISYSSKDAALARRLFNDLQAQGVPVFFAPEHLKIGAETRQAIDQAIHLNEKLLLILSKHSLESNWVQKEVETAYEKEQVLKKQYKKSITVLFPIRLDTAVMKSDYAWAADIRRMRNIGNFTHWKDHDAYQKAFERLLRDLKAQG